MTAAFCKFDGFAGKFMVFNYHKPNLGGTLMKFSEQLNEYISTCGCTAKEISLISGISTATISRYRIGERVPDIDSESFRALCCTIAQIAEKNGVNELSEASVKSGFISCSDFVSIDKERLRQNLNTLISTMNVNLSNLCQQINYDASTVFRIRNGSRQPSDPDSFAASVASYIARQVKDEADIASLAELIGCGVSELSDYSVRFSKTKCWLLEGQPKDTDNKNSIAGFLNKLDEFDLNEYIKAIHFDEMKVPSLPFQLPTSKTYYGLKEMMDSELDFLKATVLSKSKEPVTMYSDMPMTEMAKDPEFPKKWMYGMALMLKKGLHLYNIHNINRSFDEMMLGLESWIPMYMTGQISPYYLKGQQNGAFHHFLRVSGAAALSGEAISGHHSEGRYYLSKTKEDLAYYKKRAKALIETATPLMDLYREDGKDKLNSFLLSDTGISGKRKSILSAPPVYTMDSVFLKSILENRRIPKEESDEILKYAAKQRRRMDIILENGFVEDEIPQLSKKEFDIHPISLALSEMFCKTDIRYTYEEYREHIKQTEKYAALHQNYTVCFTASNPFRNLQIIMHEGKWAMISKGNAPAIHFVIHHPKLRSAIENFVPPVVEES